MKYFERAPLEKVVCIGYALMMALILGGVSLATTLIIAEKLRSYLQNRCYYAAEF